MFKRGWLEGTATIVARTTHEGMYRRGVNMYAPDGLYHHVYDYIADVQPDGGGAVFRATFTELFQSDRERRPVPGATARVKFDPKSQEVEFDRRELENDASSAHDAQAAAFAATAAAAPGTGAVAESIPVAPNQPTSSDNPRIQLLELSLRRAQSKGDANEIKRIETQLQAMRDGTFVPLPGSLAAAASTKPDPVEQLEKLADLHERGVLTDDEFATQKAKLLAEM